MAKERNWNRNDKDDNSGFKSEDLPEWHLIGHSEQQALLKGQIVKTDVQYSVENISDLLNKLSSNGRKAFLDMLKSIKP